LYVEKQQQGQDLLQKSSGTTFYVMSKMTNVKKIAEKVNKFNTLFINDSARQPTARELGVVPDWAQAQARHAGSGFFYITQKPEPTLAWFLG
jgi:hypothetical protein